MFVPLREKYIFQLKVFVLRFQKFYPFEPLGYRAIKLSCIYCYAFKVFFISTTAYLSSEGKLLKAYSISALKCDH